MSPPRCTDSLARGSTGSSAGNAGEEGIGLKYANFLRTYSKIIGKENHVDNPNPASLKQRDHVKGYPYAL